MLQKQRKINGKKKKDQLFSSGEIQKEANRGF
jgi:hypothetical protein